MTSLNANNLNLYFSCKQWREALKKNSYPPSYRICSNHFPDAAFTDAIKKHRLKVEAVPSILMVCLLFILSNILNVHIFLGN